MLKPRRTPACVLLLSGLAGGCGQAASLEIGSAAGSPVVLISIDTLRSDRLPAYGYHGIETPSIDALAADSVLFEAVYSHYPVTLPSHASIFTGLLPPEHGVRNNKSYFLEDRFETLAERLKKAGYRTGAFVSSMVLRRQTGIAQGFDRYEEPTGKPAGRPWRVFAQDRGDVALGKALGWLAEAKGPEPFFLFLHLFDPHTPYEAPEPFASRYPDPYDAEVAYTDELTGRLLKDLRARGLYDPSLIVFLSDHGEGLGDHVELEHGIFLYRESLQVPLLVKLPAQRQRGSRVRQPAALIDVAPSILGLLGLDRQGLSGHALLVSGPLPADRPIYSETSFGREQYGFADLRSVVGNDFHFIEAPRPELFDLAEDPGEQRNLLPERAVPAALREALAAVGPGIASTAEITPDEEARLAALGYLGGPAERGRSEELPDPKDRIHEAMELWSLKDKIGTTDSLVHELRAKELIEKLGVRREDFSRSIANNLLKAGRARLALDTLGSFSDSADPDTQLVLGEIALDLGRPAEARSRFEKALAVDGGSAVAHRDMGILFLSGGDPRQALPWLERAVALDAGSAEAWNGLGVARAWEKDVAGAMQAWRTAVRLDPGLADAWFNLALSLRDSGDRSGAIQALERYVPLVDGPDRAKAETLLRQLAPR